MYPDTLLISGSIASIGRTSMKMVHRVYSTTLNAVAAEGDSVLVMFDYQAKAGCGAGYPSDEDRGL